MSPPLAQRRWWRALTVEPGFLRRQILRLLMLTGLSTAVTCVGAALLYGYVARHLSVGDLPVYFAPEDMAAVDTGMMELRQALLWSLLGLVALNLLITFIVGALITARLGGPLHNFKRIMARLAAGDLTVDARLRQGDEFQDLSQNIGDAVTRLQIVVLSVRAHADALSRLPRADQDEELRQAIDGLQDAVSYFTTVDIPAPPAADRR